MPRVLNKRTGLEHPVAEGHWSLRDPDYERIDEPTGPPALPHLTVPELREYALENGIDLHGATRKADILARINHEASGEG